MDVLTLGWAESPQRSLRHRRVNADESYVMEETIEWRGQPCEIQLIDKQAGVPYLAAALAADEPPELGFDRSSPLRRLPLQHPERPQLRLRVDDVLDRLGAERTDQLVLEVCDADVEAERLPVSANEAGTEPGPFHTARDAPFLVGVAEYGELDGALLRTEALQVSTDVRRAAHRDDSDALPCEVASPSGRE